MQTKQFHVNIVQDTVHKNFCCTSSWKSLIEAIKANRGIWLKNQYHKIVNATLETLVVGKKKISREQKDIPLAKFSRD